MDLTLTRMFLYFVLKFTPLEFETIFFIGLMSLAAKLKFTPLEFETLELINGSNLNRVKIYSVGV